MRDHYIISWHVSINVSFHFFLLNLFIAGKFIYIVEETDLVQ